MIVELLLKTTTKIQDSLAIWKQNIKKRGGMRLFHSTVESYEVLRYGICGIVGFIVSHL